MREQAANKPSLSFWLIWIIGVVPMFIAFAMYYTDSLTPSNRVNQGELITQQTLSQWQLTFNNSHWQQSPQWQVLHTQPDSCSGAQCEKWNNALPSVIKLLGKDSNRVVLYQVGNLDSMLQTSKLKDLGEAVWIADPNGNLVLRYSPELTPEQLLKDLKKLLKVSKIG